MKETSALVVASADPGALAAVGDFDVVVAADSGADALLDAGRRIDVLVGDMDSISASALERVRSSGARVVEHPEAKDQTDLELALAVAAEQATSIHLVVSARGRLDHVLANVAVLTAPEFAGCRVRARMGAYRIAVVRDELIVDQPVGDLLSLLPAGGPASGVTTTGMRYPLRGETLHPWSARGISNVVVTRPARVTLTGGVLLAISELER